MHAPQHSVMTLLNTLLQLLLPYEACCCAVNSSLLGVPGSMSLSVRCPVLAAAKRADVTWLGVAVGFCSSQTATAPVTCGAAMLGGCKWKEEATAGPGEDRRSRARRKQSVASQPVGSSSCRMLVKVQPKHTHQAVGAPSHPYSTASGAGAPVGCVLCR